MAPQECEVNGMDSEWVLIWFDLFGNGRGILNNKK